MIDDYHNVHAKDVPAQLVTSRAIHMASCLVDIQQIPAVLQPPNVSIHRPVRVNVKGKELICYGGIDAASTGKHGENIHDTAPSCYAEVRCKKLKESLQQLRQVYPLNYNRGDRMIKTLL